MRLNRLETLLMNNPARAWSLRTIEAYWMRSFATPVVGGCALEIGCGRGVGVEAILAMGAREVHGFDIDPAALTLALRRLRPRLRQVRLWHGSADDIKASDACYDAVFDFGVLHHVPDWQAAVAEVGRVLRPGGCFVGEEMLRAFVDHPVARVLFDHPRDNRFDLTALTTSIERQGLRVLASGHLGGLVGWFAAEKPP